MCSFGSNLSHGAAPVGENRIGEEISLGRLQQKGGVIDPGGTNLVSGKSGAWACAHGDIFGPGFGLACELPAQDLVQAWNAETAGIVKAAAIVVVRNGKRRSPRHGRRKMTWPLVGAAMAL